ncbi:ATP-binding protein [Bacillaceae bacterium IKA-2]|nr:ATP-binding protein [Bacillaceae bacterium IKA-2]
MNKNIIMKIFVIVIVTAILGEFRISPFESSFRFALGSAGFFFLLLFYKEVPYLLTGLLTGLYTIFFRIGLDYFALDSFSFLGSLQSHSPIIGYYFTFALLLQLIMKSKFYQNPLLLGFWGALCDGLSNFVELLLIHSFDPISLLSSVETTYVIAIALFRSFFVVGLFTIFQASKLNAVYQEQRSRFEQVQTILSELYIEGFYLRKTLSDIERVTAKGHELYREIKSTKLPSELSSLALTVTQELHEVKKDNQRILAGLEKLIHHQNSNMPLALSEIINLSIKSNQKYSDYLKKDIYLSSNQEVDLNVIAAYPLLVIINNLVANAIESVTDKGYVKINCKDHLDQLIIEVTDNGGGIDIDEQEVIFEPGYTTKFDETGLASTGIGLSHVQTMVRELDGTVHVSSDEDGTSFTIYLPKSSVQAKG